MLLRRIYNTSCLVWSFVLLCAAPLFGQSAEKPAQKVGEEIQINADSLKVEEKGAKLEAKGNVELKRGETTLKAEEVRVNRETQDVSAKGNISLDDPRWKLKSAESLQLNMEKETGEIQKGDMFIEQGQLSVTGRRFQKSVGQTYHIDDGEFTTCLCESGPPHWKISAEEIDLEREGSGTIKGGTFYILDVPVFYLPRGYFPLGSERQSGFLFPEFGSSSKDGFRYRQPFFLAISKSIDATFSADVETRKRIGLSGEARTVFKQGSDAQFNVNYFNEGLRRKADQDIGDRTIADQDIPRNRWSIFTTHRYLAPSQWLAYSDVSAFSDDLFLRELDDRIEHPAGFGSRNLRQSRFASSRFGFFKGWGDTNLQGEWKFFQDFIQKDAGTFQKTPQIAFWGRRFMERLPLEFRWRAEGVNYLRRKGGDGLRFDLRPELIVPFRFSSMFGSLDLAPRETVYHLYQSNQDSSTRNPSRELIELRGNVGTSLSRIFSWKGSGLTGIKHVIEPELNYFFIPRSRQNDIPIMDGIDRVNRRNVLTFSLTNRLWGKFVSPLAAPAAEKDVELLNPAVGDVRQMGSLRLALSYDIDKERKGGDSLSDLDVGLRLTPTSYFALEFNGGLNPGPWQFTQAAPVFSISDPRPITRRSLDPDFMRPSSFSLSFRFLRKSPNGFLTEDANIDLDSPPNCPKRPLDPRCPGTGFDKKVLSELGSSVFYRVTDHLLFNLNFTLNTRDARTTSNRGAIKILSPCECWAVTFSLGRTTNPSKTSFNFNFNLLGFGNQKSTLK